MTISATTQGLRMGVATSTSRPTVPFDGQVISETDTDSLKVYNGTSWLGVSKVAQVISTAKTDTFTTASASYVDITGLSVTITPSLSTSTILVFVSINGSADYGIADSWVQLVRGSTAIAIGAASGSHVLASAMFNIAFGSASESIGVTFLDSPATTSATTYKMQICSNTTANSYINRSKTDGATSPRTISTITVMEILA